MHVFEMWVHVHTGTCAQTSICKIKMTKKISKSFYLYGSYRWKQLRADDYMECLPILKTFLKGYFHTFKTSSKLEVYLFIQRFNLHPLDMTFTLDSKVSQAVKQMFKECLPSST